MSWRLLFSGLDSFTWTTIVLLATLAALILSGWLLRLERRLVPRRVGWTLLALRTSILVLLLLTLLQPVLTRKSDLQQQSRIVVAVDASDSMETRDSHATLAEKLRWAQAGVVTIPILFSEKDRAGGDSDLATSLGHGGFVISQTPTAQSRPADAARRGFAAIGNDPAPYLFTWRGAIAPLPALAGSADGVGLLAVAPERDGVVRRLPMLARIGNTLYPSLVLETLRTAAGDPSYQIKTGDAGVEAVRIPQFPAIETDSNGRIWLAWNGKFERVEATASRQSAYPPGRWRGAPSAGSRRRRSWPRPRRAQERAERLPA